MISNSSDIEQFENNPSNFVLMYDKLGNIRHASGHLQPLLGMEAADSIGKNLFKALDANAHVCMDSALSDEAKTGTNTLSQSMVTAVENATSIEVNIRLHLGQDCQFYRLIVSPWQEADQQSQVLIIGMNTTDQQLGSKYFQAMIENFPFYFWVKDAQHKILAVNAQYLSLTGFQTPEELTGKTALEIHKPP